MASKASNAITLEPIGNGDLGFNGARIARLRMHSTQLMTHGRMEAGKMVQMSAEQVEQLGHDIDWILKRIK